MPDLSKLKEIELFRNIDDDVLQRLAPALEEQRYKDEDVIFKEDDMGDEIYFIVSGEVEVIKVVNKETGESQSLSLLGKGEFFGEMALVDRKRRSATVRAKGDIVLYRLSRENFNKFLETDARLAISIFGSMLSVTVNRLREMDVEFVTIYETGQLLATEENLNKILDSVLVKIMQIIPSSQKGFIALWNEFDEKFEIQSGKGLKEGTVIKEEDAVIKSLMEKKERLIITDTEKASIFSGKTVPEYYGRSFIIQPFIHRDQIQGFVVVTNVPGISGFTRSQINLLSGIAGQVAPVIAHTKKIREEENRRRLQRAKMQREPSDWL